MERLTKSTPRLVLSYEINSYVNFASSHMTYRLRTKISDNFCSHLRSFSTCWTMSHTACSSTWSWPLLTFSWGTPTLPLDLPTRLYFSLMPSVMTAMSTTIRHIRPSPRLSRVYRLRQGFSLWRELLRGIPNATLPTQMYALRANL